MALRDSTQQAFGPFKAPYLQPYHRANLAFRYKAMKHSFLRNLKYNQHRRFINTHPPFHLDVLDSVAAWSPSGRLAQCQRLKDYVPGVVAEGEEMHGQALDQEQLLMEEKKGSLLRGRLPMRRRPANLPIISKHLPVRICTTANHGGTRLPFPRHSRATQANSRVRRARVGATLPWKIAGPTSSA